MPFYSYSCETCKKTFKAFHSPDEIEEKCIVCKSTNLKKIIPTVRKVDSIRNESAGSRVEKFIEESREALQQQMQESRKDYK